MVLVDVIRVLHHIAREYRDHIRALIDHTLCDQFLDAGQRRRRSRFAADARQTDLSLGVGDLLLRHLLHRPVGRPDLVQRLWPRHGIANANRRRQRFRIRHRMELARAATLPILIERSRMFRLNHRQPRQLVDQAQSLRLTQPLAERRRVAEVAAGQHHPIRHLPIALVQHLEHDRLLALDAERIHGVQQVDPQPLGQYADQRQDLIEVRFHLQGLRAIFQRLRQFRERDLAVGQEDQRLHAG